MAHIFGIGVDMLEITRMHQLYLRQRERAILRLLTVEEQATFESRMQQSNARGIRFLASRFAAKEAFLKAMGTGLRPPFTWHSIALQHDPLGRPIITLSPNVAAWCAEQGAGAIHVSLSDTETHVVAFVTIERRTLS